MINYRWGTWAEYVTVSAAAVLVKPETYSFAQAAALPMSSLVAWGAVKAAGFQTKPAQPIRIDPNAAVQEVRDGVHTLYPAQVQSPTIAVIGASSTIGSIVVNMLAGRGEKVVGVCSAGNAGPVLRNGAVTVLDRKKGGLELKVRDEPDLNLSDINVNIYF